MHGLKALHFLRLFGFFVLVEDAVHQSCASAGKHGCCSKVNTNNNQMLRTEPVDPDPFSVARVSKYRIYDGRSSSNSGVETAAGYFTYGHSASRNSESDSKTEKAVA